MPTSDQDMDGLAEDVRSLRLWHGTDRPQDQAVHRVADAVEALVARAERVEGDARQARDEAKSLRHTGSFLATIERDGLTGQRDAARAELADAHRALDDEREETATVRGLLDDALRTISEIRDVSDRHFDNREQNARDRGLDPMAVVRRLLTDTRPSRSGAAEAAEPEKMRWTPGPIGSLDNTDRIVTWVNANGGQAEFHPRRPGWVDDEPSIEITTSVGPDYIRPGDEVVKGERLFCPREQPHPCFTEHIRRVFTVRRSGATKDTDKRERPADPEVR